MCQKCDLFQAFLGSSHGLRNEVSSTDFMPTSRISLLKEV
jgi:hypothetical protein